MHRHSRRSETVVLTMCKWSFWVLLLGQVLIALGAAVLAATEGSTTHGCIAVGEVLLVSVLGAKYFRSSCRKCSAREWTRRAGSLPVMGLDIVHRLWRRFRTP